MIIQGVVVEGRRLGRQLGFPTANISVVGDGVEGGVYESRVMIEGVEYKAVTNVGVNPTVGMVARRAESYILDFEGDLYGRELSFELVRRLREEVVFESVDQLREQILRDIESVAK